MSNISVLYIEIQKSDTNTENMKGLNMDCFTDLDL